MRAWQVNQARNHLSEVLEQAETAGPQVITHHGKERAVVLSIEEYRRLQSAPPAKLDFISFLLSGPKDDDWVFEPEPEVPSEFEVEFE